MKKINSVPGGKLIVISLLFSFIFSTIIIILSIEEEPSVNSIIACIMPLLILLGVIHFIKNGCLSYLQIDDFQISNEDYSIGLENVHITIVADYHPISPRALAIIMYVDDHYLTEDEIKNKKYKMFVILTSKRREYILSKYNKKVKIIEKYNDKRIKVFLEHNSKYN